MTTLRVVANRAIRVEHLALACCALEVESAIRLGLLEPELPDAPPAERTVLLAAGTMTAPLAEAVRTRARDAGPGVSVVAYGACASTGGPYWDAPSVVNGIDTAVPVHRYVPGCPPSPQALVAALLEDSDD